jgi:phospholipid/cholesterol/gamma-HCH transport system ATP-binding protein
MRAFSMPASIASDNLIELTGVDFSYDRRPVLTGIDMAIPRGKVVAIMGVSGSGKTTLLRLISRVVKTTRGQVRVDGKLVNELDRQAVYDLRRRMGMLFQFGALFTDLSVYDNVAFQMREHTDLPERMIRDLVLMKLHAVGLRGAHRLMPSELSGGMARRVALARAIALDPMLIMYDEPFTGLDPISMGMIVRLVRQMNYALGITSIVVSHDVEELSILADSSYIIAGGKVAASGSFVELKDHDSEIVHQFINGLADGPVAFHYPAPDYYEDLLAG